MFDLLEPLPSLCLLSSPPRAPIGGITGSAWFENNIAVLRPHILAYSTSLEGGYLIQCNVDWTINSICKPVEFGPACVLWGAVDQACKDMFAYVSFDKPSTVARQQKLTKYVTLGEEQPMSLFFAKQVGDLHHPVYKTRWLWWWERLLTKTSKRRQKIIMVMGPIFCSATSAAKSCFSSSPMLETTPGL